MIANTHSLPSKAKRMGTTLAVASTLFGASQVWADPEIKSAPLGVYVGVAGGFAPSHRICEGNSTDYCDHLTYGSKMFAGWNMYNDVALEVSYLYFNGVNRVYDTVAENRTVGSDRVRTRAATLGFDWHIDLLHGLGTHLRAGVARNETLTDIVYRTGVQAQSVEYKTVPFVGAGLSISVNDYFRLESAFDYIFAGHDSRHLLSIGAVGEF